MDLCIGRNTVESAYDQLYAGGYVESKQGSGFMVMDLTKDSLKFPNMVDGRIIDRNDPPQNDKQNSSTAEQKKIIVIDHAGISYSAQTAYSAVGKIHPMLRNNLYANTSWMVAMGALKIIYTVF